MSLPLPFVFVLGALLLVVLRAFLAGDQPDAFTREVSRIEREIEKVSRKVERLEADALQVLGRAPRKQPPEAIR